MLLFNKQYRNEQKLITEIYKKIRNSKEMTRGDKYDMYKLDNVDIVFGGTDGQAELIVNDKSGNEIYKMDCNWSDPIKGDELQQRRWDWFHGLLEFARKQYDERENKKEKLKRATADAKAKAVVKQKQRNAEKIKEAAVLNALDRLQNL
jgi:hypothetical protein